MAGVWDDSLTISVLDLIAQNLPVLLDWDAFADGCE